MFVNIPLNASIKNRGCLYKFFWKRVGNPSVTRLWQRPADLLGSHEALPCRVHVTGAMPPPTTPPPLQLVECSLPSMVLFPPSLLTAGQERRGAGASGLTELGSRVIDPLPTCQLLRSEGFLLVTDLCFGVSFWSLQTFFMAAASFSHRGSL